MKFSQKPGRGKAVKAFHKAAAAFAGLEALESRSLYSAALPSAPSTGSSADQVIGVAPITQLALPSTTQVITYRQALAGEPVSVFAVVTVTGDFGLSPGGTVTFFLDGKAVSDPKSTSYIGLGIYAETSVTFPSVGPHVLTASYSGIAPSNASYGVNLVGVGSSTSDPLTVTVIAAPAVKSTPQLKMALYQPPVAVSDIYPKPPPSPNATSQVIEVDLSSDLALPLTGTFSLYDSDVLLATAPVADPKSITQGLISQIDSQLNGTGNEVRGQAFFTVSTAGHHHLRVVYSGDDAHLDAAATGTLNMTGGLAYDVGLWGPPQVPSNATFAITAAVTSMKDTIGSSHPSGQVLLFDGSTQVGSAILDDAGHATFTISGIESGIHSYSAFYTDSLGMYGFTSTSTSWGEDYLRSLGPVNDLFYSAPVDQTGLTIAAGSPNQIYVAQLYRDLLHRNPESSGSSLWASRLDAGASRGSIVSGILSSDEYRTTLVNSYYRQYLNRDAGPGEVASWVKQLDSSTSEQVVLGFLSSDEFLTRHGNYRPNVAEEFGLNPQEAGYIDALYDTLLNRTATTHDDTYWVGILDQIASSNSSLTATDVRYLVAQSIMQSQEYANLQAASFYTAYLRRSADDGGIAKWAATLMNGSQSTTLNAFLSSDEYFGGLNVEGKAFYFPQVTQKYGYGGLQVVTMTDAS